MPSHQSPELVDLFTTYTAGPGSIGSHLTRAAVENGSADPLIVATSADFALYPGDGFYRPPSRTSASPPAASRNWPVSRTSAPP